MGKRLELEGQVFGRLTVLAFAGVKDTLSRWLCKCECRNKVIVIGRNLRSGVTKSCGCQKGNGKTTHGQSQRTKEYRAWSAMLTRCYNTKQKTYGYYGGRGVTVCERWHSFEAFFEDVGKAPAPEYSIDRIDPDGNYEPLNVRWATKAEQSSNQRRFKQAG